MKKRLLAIIAIAILGMSCKKRDDKLIMQSQLSKNELKSGDSKTLATTTYNVTPTTDLGSSFWTQVQNSLQTGPVDVVFTDGTYTRTSTIGLSAIGHTTNLLTLKTAVTAGGAVFTGGIAKLLTLTNCKNILLQRLKFTGPVTDYAVTISKSPGITVDRCFFINLPQLYYGALGVHYPASDNTIVKYCEFNQVGIGSTAHMIYGAYGTTRLKVVKNTFIDCAGAFVRFRGNLSTQGVVYENSFQSTGTYKSGSNPPFIEVPVFNDIDPGDERFGTMFMVTKNTFTYSTSGSQTTRYAMVFNHSGYNPSDRIHLISAAEGSTLHSGTVTQKRAIMSAKLGLDGDQIQFGTNTNTNVQYNVSYRCQGGYGAVAPWTGVASIGTAINPSGLATTEAAALTFYDNLH